MTGKERRANRPPAGLVIATGRLILRNPRMEDAAAIAAVANDREIAERLTRMPHPYGLADAEAWLRTLAARDEETARMRPAALITEARTGTVMGAVGLDGRAPGCGNAPQLGYWLGRGYWNRGYATEAARALCTHGFTALDATSISASIAVSNRASRAVLEKCGFRSTGAGLDRCMALAGLMPVERFALTREHWTGHGDAETGHGNRREAAE